MNSNIHSEKDLLKTIWGILFANTDEHTTGYILTHLNQMIESLGDDQLDDETFDRVALAVEHWEPPRKIVEHWEPSRKAVKYWGSPRNRISNREDGINYLAKTFGFLDNKDVFWPKYA